MEPEDALSDDDQPHEYRITLYVHTYDVEEVAKREAEQAAELLERDGFTVEVGPVGLFKL